MPSDPANHQQEEPRLVAARHPRRRADIEIELMPDGSALLYDAVTDQAQVLAPLAALIWEMLDGMLSETELAAQIASDVPPLPQPAATLAAVLQDFRAQGLIEEP